MRLKVDDEVGSLVSDLRTTNLTRAVLLSVRDIAQLIEEQCEIRKLWLLTGFSVVYWIWTCLLASRKLLWNDELFTLYTSRLPNISDIWSLLRTGADQVPLLFHLITRASLTLFGINAVTVRLPEMLGFWIMSLCLFRFVAKRSSALLGFVAMLFPMATAAYEYAYEARPYGIVLGLAGLSLVSWQSATELRSRKLSLISLGLSLAAAISTHYYALLLLFPVALGELMRSLSRRCIDLAVWATLGCSLTPLVLLLPLIKGARRYSGAFWAKPDWGSAADFYNFLLTPTLTLLAAIAVFPAICATAPPDVDNLQRREGHPSLPLHELFAAFGFAVLPAVTVTLAMFVTHAFTHRYALAAVLGFSILFTFASCRMLNGRAIISTFVLFALCTHLIILNLNRLEVVTDAIGDLRHAYKFLQAQTEGPLPIVAADLHTFMLFKYYYPEGLDSRLVYLADPTAAVKYLGHDTVDRGILDLEPWFRLNVREYTPYVASQPRFFVYGKPGSLNWLFHLLPTDGMQMELKATNGDNFLFVISVNDQRKEK